MDTSLYIIVLTPQRKNLIAKVAREVEQFIKLGVGE